MFVGFFEDADGFRSHMKKGSGDLQYKEGKDQTVVIAVDKSLLLFPPKKNQKRNS